MKRDYPNRVGQVSDLTVDRVSDPKELAPTKSAGEVPAIVTGLQRRLEPADRRSAPQGKDRRLVSGLHSRGALPHLKREGGTYFVTFRLAGTLPGEVVLKLKAEREAILTKAEAEGRPLSWHEQQRLFNWYSERVDACLDAGYGECWLNRPEIADLVANAIRFFEHDRYLLHAWVVMPNHVHAVVHPHAPHTLSSILKSWKGYTALQANQILNRSGTAFWQSESYDHLCRNDDDIARCCEYVRMNPVKAGLCPSPEQWRWGGAYVRQVSDLTVGGVSDPKGGQTTDVREGGTGLRRRPEPADRRSAPRPGQDFL